MSDRPTKPPVVDLDPTEYREVDPPRRRGEPFFRPGGLLYLASFLALLALGLAYSAGMGALIRGLMGW